MYGYNNKKEIFGKILLGLSVLMLIYLFISPLTHFFIHLDEYYTLTIMSVPFSDFLTITSHDVHPQLYFIIAKLMVDFFSFTNISHDTLFVLKIVSIIPYLLILIISFTKIRNEYGWFTAGLFSFSMFIMSDFFYHYLVIRMYSWAILFLLITFLYFKDVITTFDKKSLIIFTIFAVACAYTQYITAVSAGVIYLMFLIYLVLFDHKEKIKYWVMSVVAAALMFSPWVLVLFSQMNKVHDTMWIPKVTIESTITAFSFFAHTDFIPNFILLLILVAFIIIYYIESIDIEDIECFYMVSGFSTYILTIIITVLISFLFKPILVSRYLLPASAVLWLVISILISKINNKKIFFASIAIILLLLCSGIGDVISDSQGYYDVGMQEQEIIDSIANDNNSIVITTSPFKLLAFDDKWDMYCILNDTYGESPKQLHQLYDFKELNSNDVDNFIKNNSDKNIYIVGVNNPKLSDDVILTSLYKIWGLKFSKVFNYNTTVSIGYKGLSEIKIPEGFNVENISAHYLALGDGVNTYILCEYTNKSLDSIFEEYYNTHKENKVTQTSFNVSDVVVSGLELEKDGKYVHTNYYFEKNGVIYQIYPKGNSSMDILKEIVASAK